MSAAQRQAIMTIAKMYEDLQKFPEEFSNRDLRKINMVASHLQDVLISSAATDTTEVGLDSENAALISVADGTRFSRKDMGDWLD